MTAVPGYPTSFGLVAPSNTYPQAPASPSPPPFTYYAACRTVPAGPAGYALVASVDIPDYGVWLDNNRELGDHIAFNVLDRKPPTSFNVWKRGAAYQEGSISTGVGVALGRCRTTAPEAVLEKFRKPDGGGDPLVVSTAHPLTAASIRVVVVARVTSASTVEIGMLVTDLYSGATLVPFTAVAEYDDTADFGLGVSLIVIGRNVKGSPTFQNVTYNWAQ